MKKFPIIVLGVAIVALMASCSNKKKDLDKLVDSIYAAQWEEMRLDSLRQDSITRREMTTVDLEFLQLHGDVKECKGDWEMVRWCMGNNEPFKFNEKGEWTNAPVKRTIRDKEGRVIKIKATGDGDIESLDFKWVEGRIAETNLGKYEFSEEGLPIAFYEGAQSLGNSRTIYTDYVLDGVGNWIERTATTYCYEYDDYPQGIEVEREKRYITYYKSDGKGRESLPNTPKQEQLLESEKRKFKYAEYEAEHRQSEENMTQTQNGSSGSESTSIYSTPAGKEAYLEVLRLNKEIKELINESAKYRRIMSYSRDPYEYQMADIENTAILNEAIKKQQQALSIARSVLKDPQLIKELEGKLRLLQNARYN